MKDYNKDVSMTVASEADETSELTLTSSGGGGGGGITRLRWLAGVLVGVACVSVIIVIIIAVSDSGSGSSGHHHQPSVPPLHARPTFTLPCGVEVTGEWRTVEKEPRGVTSPPHPPPSTSTSSPLVVDIAVFRSIPFAEPPTGPLRFGAPVDRHCPLEDDPATTTTPAARRSGEERSPTPNTTSAQLWNATDEKPRCIQQSWAADNETIGSEDCLYLTIHVPKTVLEGSKTASLSSSKSGVPVLMYIFGGDLTSGYSNHEPLSFLSANSPSPSGVTAPAVGGDAANVSDDVIVVATNYRLGALGWLAVEAMTANFEHTGRHSNAGVVGNFGLQDQLSALRWIQANIRHVGGDPSRVTIMGQSSGGTSVLALVQSPLSAGLFRAAISLSGSPNITMGRAAKFAQDASYAKAVGCDNQKNATVQMSCLRSVSASDFVLKMPNSWNTPGTWNLLSLNKTKTKGLDLAGLVYVDGVAIPYGIEEAMRRGTINGNVTLVMGNMGQEPNLSWPPHQNVVNFTVPQWNEFLTKEVFSTWATKTEGANKSTNLLASEVISRYREEALVNPLLAYYTINTDYSIYCASVRLASLVNRSREAPFYIYENQWPPETPNDNGALSFAFHVWDYMCGIHDFNRYGPYNASKQDLSLSRLLRSHWGSIFHTGKMSKELNWPRSNGSGASSSTSSLSSDESDVGSPPTAFVYSRPDRFPFFNVSRGRVGYKVDRCDKMFRPYGINETYWWCN